MEMISGSQTGLGAATDCLFLFHLPGFDIHRTEMPVKRATQANADQKNPRASRTKPVANFKPCNAPENGQPLIPGANFGEEKIFKVRSAGCKLMGRLSRTIDMKKRTSTDQFAGDNLITLLVISQLSFGNGNLPDSSA